MYKQQLRESLSYRHIKRGMTRPQSLASILEHRMADLVSKRLEEIKTQVGGHGYGRSDRNN